MEIGTVPPAFSLAALAPTTLETAVIVGVSRPRRAVAGTGLDVFPIALNAKHFGGAVSEETAVEILDTFSALGGNLIDTADAYGEGRSEQIIGRWMQRRGNRDRLVIATKVGRSVANPGLSAAAITASVAASMRRLCTDRLDVLYLHVDDTEVPFEETLLAVDELIRREMVRTFGLSDHTGTRLLAARVACALLGVAPMTVLQNEYSLLHRSGYEGDLARVAEQQGLAVMPRFPLAGGLLLTAAAESRMRAHPPGDGRHSSDGVSFSRRTRRIRAVVGRIADELGVGPGTVALAWLLGRPGVVAPVVSVESAPQLFEVMSAPELRLTRHHLAELERVSR